MDIKYEIKTGECVTFCENMGSGASVGSIVCTRFCKFFDKNDEENKIISCLFDKNLFYL